jgi:hypothetical protein
MAFGFLWHPNTIFIAFLPGIFSFSPREMHRLIAPTPPVDKLRVEGFKGVGDQVNIFLLSGVSNEQPVSLG